MIQYTSSDYDVLRIKINYNESDHWCLAMPNVMEWWKAHQKHNGEIYIPH